MEFTEILDQYNVEYKTEGHHHCRPGWIQIDCPFCAKDTYKWHMGYSLEGHYLHCWRCGPHRPIETLMEIIELPFGICKKLLDDIIPVRIKKEKPKGKLVIPKGVVNLLPIHIRYLQSREFNPKHLKRIWRIQGIGLAANLAWRIFIPIFYHGKRVSWTTRTVSNNPNVTRYISASIIQESIPHKALLYGEDYCKKEAVIVQEGPTDVWRTGPGAVATLGTSYSNKQLLRMTKYKKRIICFDNIKEAQERAKVLCDDLSVFPGETLNIQLNAKDAATASIKEIKLLRKELYK